MVVTASGKDWDSLRGLRGTHCDGGHRPPSASRSKFCGCEGGASIVCQVLRKDEVKIGSRSETESNVKFPEIKSQKSKVKIPTPSTSLKAGSLAEVREGWGTRSSNKI